MLIDNRDASLNGPAVFRASGSQLFHHKEDCVRLVRGPGKRGNKVRTPRKFSKAEAEALQWRACQFCAPE